MDIQVSVTMADLATKLTAEVAETGRGNQAQGGER